MVKFFVAGGFPMWVVLIFGLLCLGTAIRFAFTATPRRLAVIRALSWATAFSILSGVASNFMAVMWHVPGNPEWSREPLFPVMQGLGEAVTPAILGFTLLAIAWLLVAVGLRRMADEP